MKKIFFSIFLIALSSMVLTACSSPEPILIKNSDTNTTMTLGECLTSKNVKMYGTEWCSHCKNQKALFGDDFANVDYIDCDKNKAECNAVGIRGYPTWSFNGELSPGEKSLETLASIAGCD